MSVSSTQAQAAALHAVTTRTMSVKRAGTDTLSEPLDLETTLQKKLHVADSEDRDHTEQMSDSEVPCPISSRTRSRVKKKRRAAVHRDESADVPVDDGDVERVKDIGAGATLAWVGAFCCAVPAGSLLPVSWGCCDGTFAHSRPNV